MNLKQTCEKRFFVLDTNVLMHDPAAMFRFEEHDIYIPMVVLEELDNAKKGLSEVARNARQASRFLDELLANADSAAIDEGLILKNHYISTPKEEIAAGQQQGNLSPAGRLFFETHTHVTAMPDAAPVSKPDNAILAAAIDLHDRHPEADVVLVSKDINMRIKATVLGIRAEDFFGDRPIENADLLYSGVTDTTIDFSQTTPAVHLDHQGYWVDINETQFIKQHWVPNQCFNVTSAHADENAPTQTFIYSDKDDKRLFFREALDHSLEQNSVWGITARNVEQNFALNLLLDPAVDFVTLLGAAGSGKTLLALAAGLEQVMEKKLYREILMTRVTVPIGDDIGFLPGTEEEKMTPWMGALMDNLEVLTDMSGSGEWQKQATNDLIASRIKVRSLNFMRGRTFQQRYLIIDEAQNLTPKQMKTLITRAGNGTKLVCLGDISQIDTPYLTETTSGLTYAVDNFKPWDHSGHITLQRGERSRLAAFAADHL